MEPAQGHSADKWGWGGVAVSTEPTASDGSSQAASLLDQGMAGRSIAGRGGRATPIRRPRFFLLTSLPRERDAALSWGLVSVQETQTPWG